MKFIFEYVSCCIKIKTPSSSSSSSSSCDTVESPTSTGGRRRKRAPARGTSEDWQPSLFAITEDNIVAAAPVVGEKRAVNVNRTAAKPVRKDDCKRNVNRCAGSSVRVNPPSQSYHFSRDPLPLVIPAFSAAPFMF